MKTTLAVFGGTFDPIHIGHLQLLVEVQEQCQFDQIKVIPCRLPALKAQPSVSAQQRVEMLQLGLDTLDDQSSFQIDTRELERGGPSYTIDTLRSLRTEYGDEKSITLILGLDAYANLPNWHQADAVTKLANILVVNRPGETADQNSHTDHTPLDSVDATLLRQSSAGLKAYCRITPLDIASSQIRLRISQNKNVRYLLPTAVWKTIQARGLYGYNGAAQNS